MQRFDGTRGGDIGSSKSCFLRDIFMSVFIFTWIGFLTVSVIKKYLEIRMDNKIF